MGTFVLVHINAECTLLHICMYTPTPPESVSSAGAYDAAQAAKLQF